MKLGTVLPRLVLVALFGLPAWNLSAQAPSQSPRLGLELQTPDEAALMGVFDDVRENRLESALDRVSALVARNPKFRLAQLVFGDLLLAKSGAITGFGGPLADPKGVIAGLRHEAVARYNYHVASPRAELLPEFLLEMSQSQSRAVVVDVAASRLYLFENTPFGPQLQNDYYVSTGRNGPLKLREGDRKTPLGVYFITGRISPKKLPDFYGSGAFPVNYPNEWDRKLGRTGSGIWIHGVPTATYSRAPRASDGCMALSNTNVEALWNTLDVQKTPVIISDGVRWVDTPVVTASRDRAHALVKRWRADWESLEHERYARNYAPNFQSGTKDFAAWMGHKKRVNANKTFVRVGLSDVSLFAYPGEPELLVVSFDQAYRSNNYSSDSRKRQYWRRGADGEWRIVYEGPT